MTLSRLIAGPCLSTLILLPGPASSAADQEGSYAVRGAGAQSCALFVEMASEDRPEVSFFLAWIEGYMTGHNYLTEETFDVSPLVSPREVALVLREVCRAEPEIRVETAMARLLNLFAPLRVEGESEIGSFAVDDSTVFLRLETLARVQETLREEGHYTGRPDGIFGPGTQAALRAYQEAEGLPVTGLPDANTIIRILAGLAPEEEADAAAE